MTRAPIRSTGRSAVASSIGADTATTTQIPAAEAVTIREPRAATWATAAGGTTVRPRRPCGRSRADHAVTASRSRSMRNWSGTSIATAGHEPRGQRRGEQQQAQTTRGSACSSAPAPVTRNSPDAHHDPDPQRLVALHVEGAGHAGGDRGDQRGDADDGREPLRLGRPDHRERRGGGERRGGHHAVRAEPPDRQHPEEGREAEQRDGQPTLVGVQPADPRTEPAGQSRDRRRPP